MAWFAAMFSNLLRSKALIAGFSSFVGAMLIEALTEDCLERSGGGVTED
jgi:hypothetical protein